MSDDKITSISPGQPSSLNPEILPMIHILILSLNGIPRQLVDNGLSESEAAEIQDATDRLTASLKRIL